jgi:hypothetical protein
VPQNSDMEMKPNTEDLFRAASVGDKTAESEILSKLFARFLPIVSLTIKTHPVLAKEMNIEVKCGEVCQKAINDVARLYPLNSERFSIKRAVSVLHNVLDDFIANTLYQHAKTGSSEAEESLFSLIRQKLIIYLKSKLWRN